MTSAWPQTAYFHLPFCAHHCAYCDFAVTTGHDDLMLPYVEALELEIQGILKPATVQTRFFGGGTPSYLSIELWHRLAKVLDQWLPLQSNGEFSIEANPDDLTDEKIKAFRDLGINRLSIGVQSFQPDLLPALDRRHDSSQAIQAIERARKHFSSVSIDLIFSIPGQNASGWKRDLQQAIDLGVDHISTYGLTYEKGTPLWKQLQHGQVKSLEEEEERGLYEAAIDTLNQAGFEHYEISNFAKPNHRCKHNETYWANEEYFGFGVGAARFVNQSRELNVRNTKDYIRKLFSGESPTFQRERLNDREFAFETLAIQLRRMDGIFWNQFQAQTGFDAHELVGLTLKNLDQIGLIVFDEIGFRLTRDGKCLADGVVAELLKAA
jgi:oxygen-independent coproporphyrinogen III oxidase